MCGIIGYIGKENFSLDKLKILFIMNESRGKDSCGLYVKGKGIVKAEGEVTKNLLPYVDLKISNVAVGHVRQATIGSKTKENSHPFREDNLIQVHNGKIDNYIALARQFDFDPKDYKVDSQVMLKVAKHFYNNSSYQYVLSTLQEVTGAISMLLYDTTKADELIYFTNGERPLFYGEISEGNYYFSSTEEALLIIGVSLSKITAVPKNQVHVLNSTTNTISSTPFVKVVKPIVTTVPASKIIRDFVHPASNNSWDDMRDIYKKATGTIDDIPTKLEITNTVEFENNDGKSIIGKVIAVHQPFNNIYLVKSDDGLDFISGELLTLIQEDSYKIEDFNMEDTVIVMRTKEKKHYRAHGTISYVDNHSKIIYCDFPGQEYDEFFPEEVIELIKRSKPIIKTHYVADDDVICQLCNDEGKIAGHPCPDCTSPFSEDVEIIPNEESLSYDDFDCAYELYTELESQPSFHDESNLMESWSEEDVTLATEIKKNKLKLNNLTAFSDDERRDLLISNTSMMNRRSILLTLMVDAAKKLEKQLTL